MNLLGIIGKSASSQEVSKVLAHFALDEVDEDPPFRRYVGSKVRGLELLFEEDALIAIQVFLKPAQGFTGFAGDLPLGLRQDMSVLDVLTALGPPHAQDEWSVTYVIGDEQLVINIDKQSHMTYLNIGRRR